ncbi:hypothetical protein GCM10010313_20060 [Streptomyces violarus]|nr:hypothetical protein GCM10010313_20060 [Streptomyces violarus]
MSLGPEKRPGEAVTLFKVSAIGSDGPSAVTQAALPSKTAHGRFRRGGAVAVDTAIMRALSKPPPHGARRTRTDPPDCRLTAMINLAC